MWYWMVYILQCCCLNAYIQLVSVLLKLDFRVSSDNSGSNLYVQPFLAISNLILNIVY